MKEKRIRIPFIALLLFLSVFSARAQQAVPPAMADLPDRVSKTGELIGVKSQLLELVRLRETPAGTEEGQIRELLLVQQLQGAVLKTQLELQSVRARIDYEVSRLDEIQSSLSARRDRRANIVNISNLVLASGVGAVGNGLEISSTTAKAGSIVATVAGAAGTVLSVAGLQQKGGVHTVGQTPSMLAEMFNRPPLSSSEYPPVIWQYLNAPNQRLPSDMTPREALFQQWVASGRLTSSNPAQTGPLVNSLTSSGVNGIPLGIGIIADRVAMLADLRAQVAEMDVDLSRLIRFITAAGKAPPEDQQP
jgi:hypothetical protein